MTGREEDRAVDPLAPDMAVEQQGEQQGKHHDHRDHEHHLPEKGGDPEGEVRGSVKRTSGVILESHRGRFGSLRGGW